MRAHRLPCEAPPNWLMLGESKQAANRKSQGNGDRRYGGAHKKSDGMRVSWKVLRQSPGFLASILHPSSSAPISQLTLH